MAAASENGPRCKMYQVKPYYGYDVLVFKSDVMYKVQNLHADSTTKELTMVNSDDPAVALEQRQEAIFRKLQELKGVVEGLKRQYGDTTANTSNASVERTSSTRTNVTSSQAQPDVLKGDVVLDMVISADPENPPLSLFVMYELLKQRYKVGATTFIHSSAVNVPENLKTVFEQNSGQGTQARGDNQLMITVIWKKVENGPTLMVEPHRQTPIMGESNIARYITRLLNPNCDTEDIVKATQIDEWLDTANLQVLQGNNKEKAAVLRSLNSRLGRNDWLVGSEVSLADIVMWSALHQSKQTVDGQANVKRWLNSCSKTPTFQSARTLIC